MSRIPPSGGTGVPSPPPPPHTAVIKHSKKQQGICIFYTYISEFMLWLHRGKFASIK